MEKVDISKDFTVDDIHKIREAHYEKTKNLSLEELLEDLNKVSPEVESIIQSLREKREKYQP